MVTGRIEPCIIGKPSVCTVAVKRLKSDCNSESTGIFHNRIVNLNISCKVVFSLNKWNKKVGSSSSFGRKRPLFSLNSSASIGDLSSFERARARVRANHAKNDAQKGCAMQLNGITLNLTLSLNPCHVHCAMYPF